MSDFFQKAMNFTGGHWLWLLGGAILVVLLWLFTLLGRERTVPARGLLAPLNWYAGHRGARRLTVNALGIALVVWFAQTFALWVQPSLTPDMLFTPPVVGPQPVDVVMAEQRPLEDRVSYTGSVQPYEDAWVHARVDGWVKDLAVYPGDVVKQGQVLAGIEISALEPRLRHAQSEVTFWKAEHQRDRELFEAGAISASQWDKTQEQYAVAKAKLAQVQTDIGYATLKAPMDGIVSERKIYPGVYVKKGEPVLKIDQLNRVRIQFEVAEQDLLWMRIGTPVYLRFPQADPALIRETFADLLVPTDDEAQEEDNAKAKEPPLLKGNVDVVFPAENPRTRTGTVEVRLPNSGGMLKTNTYVVGELVRRRVDDAIAIPLDALTPVPEGGDVVFLGPAFSEEGAAERREVTLGLRTDSHVQVLTGIEAGEFAVTRGNRVLTDGETVRVVNRQGGLF